MQNETQFGEVITFYSYKGGTGRTMALANIGCVLAQTPGTGSRKKVLLIDWDLEAPGLHHFLPPSDNTPADGLLEFFIRLAERTESVRSRDEALQLLEDTPLDSYVRATAVPGLEILRAGRFDDTYGARVNAFSWERFYTAAPPLLPAFAEFLATQYEFVLVDSRTGITDVSGICTTILPSKLVVVFTPNRQSLTGIFELVRRATKYRRESSDWRPLSIFPLPSRIEPAREQLMTEWRHGTDAVPGYQPQFESLFREVYALDEDECDLTDYLNEVQIQHVADYAYGEQVAVLVETATRLSLKRSYEEFASRLRTVENAWQDVAVARVERDIAGRLQIVSDTIERRALVDAWSMLRGIVELYRANENVSVPELSEVAGHTAAGLLEDGKTKEALEMLAIAVDVETRESGAAAPETAERLLDLARGQAAAGIYRDALATAERAFEISSALKAAGTGDALRVIAEVRAAMGDVDGSSDAYEKSIVAAREYFGEESDEIADALLQLASVKVSAHRYQEAEELLERVRAIYDRKGAFGEIPAVLRQQSFVRAAMGDFDAAEALLQKVLAIQRETSAPPADVADTMEQLADVATQREDLPAARKHLEEAYFLRSTTRDRTDPAIIDTLRQIGVLAARQGEWDVARGRLEMALSIADSSLPPEHVLHATVRRSLAEVFADQGHYEAAEQLVHQAMKLAEGAANDREVGRSAMSLGRLRYLQRDDAAARHSFTLALQTFEKIGDRYGQAITQSELATCLASAGETAEARERLLHARAIFLEMNAPRAVEIVDEKLAGIQPIA